MTFGPLEAGTYWIPVYSVLSGAHGDYQVHVTVQACVTAACCYNTCSAGANVGLHCDKNVTCPGGTCAANSDNPNIACTEHRYCGPLANPLNICSVTCEAQCDVVEKDVCDDRLGFFLAPPNIYPAVPLKAVSGFSFF